MNNIYNYLKLIIDYLRNAGNLFSKSMIVRAGLLYQFVDMSEAQISDIRQAVQTISSVMEVPPWPQLRKTWKNQQLHFILSFL